MFNLKTAVKKFIEQNNIKPYHLSKDLRLDAPMIYTWLHSGRRIREDHYETLLNWYLQQTGGRIDL